MTTFSSRKGAYPGSFNPPTLAHLAIADAARMQRRLTRVDLVVSRVALDKESVVAPSFDERLLIIEESIVELPWLHVVVSEHQLLADIASDYDVVIMGTDKWRQLHEVRYYESEVHMAASFARLPELAIASRPPHFELPDGAELAIDEEIAAAVAEMSSSGALAGRHDWMTPAARRIHGVPTGPGSDA